MRDRGTWERLACVTMRAHHPFRVMPALVAGIHVFLAGFAAKKTWMAGTSPAMTLNKWINMTGTRFNAWVDISSGAC